MSIMSAVAASPVDCTRDLTEDGGKKKVSQISGEGQADNLISKGLGLSNRVPSGSHGLTDNNFL